MGGESQPFGNQGYCPDTQVGEIDDKATAEAIKVILRERESGLPPVIGS